MADLSKGDMNHAIVKSYDEATETLKTTITNPTIDVTVNATMDSIVIADISNNKTTTTLVGSKRGLDVNVVDITLDSGSDSILAYTLTPASISGASYKVQVSPNNTDWFDLSGATNNITALKQY